MIDKHFEHKVINDLFKILRIIINDNKSKEIKIRKVDIFFKKYDNDLDLIIYKLCLILNIKETPFLIWILKNTSASLFVHFLLGKKNLLKNIDLSIKKNKLQDYKEIPYIEID